jgi:filamentous hemagglutinin family protein
MGLGMVGAIALVSPPPVFAQITSDGSLGTDIRIQTTTNGARNIQIRGGTPRGNNLFHSFQDFNIQVNETVLFQAPGIQNILSRVTGANPSNINGTLAVLGNANLFLINPNGIIFGPNARLGLTGSFLATTANGVRFNNQEVFSSTSPTVPSLLAVHPSALLYNQIAAARAVRSQAQLRVNSGRSLLLVGGDIILSGGELLAPRGRVDLAAVAGSGTVELVREGNRFAIAPLNHLSLGNIELSGGVLVDSRGGTVQLQGRQIWLREGAQAGVGTLGNEPGGNLTVFASESVHLTGTHPDGFRPSGFFANSSQAGAAGTLSLTAPKLVLQDGAEISASTFGSGRGGQLWIHANDIELSGTSKLGLPSGIAAIARQGTGSAGQISLISDRLTVKDGAQISSSAAGGSQGSGGSLDITASEFVVLSGSSLNSGFRSGLFVGTIGPNNGGDLRIQTPNLTVEKGAIASAKTAGQGNGGDVRVFSDRVTVQSGGEISVNSRGGGKAGDMRLEASRLVLDGGKLTAETASGDGGNINLAIADQIFLRHAAQISTTAGTAQSGGNGGNIHITTPFLIAFPDENSDITANAFTGNGGSVRITAQAILGLAFRPQPTSQNDITASSTFGSNGVVELNTPGVDPNKGLVSLPLTWVDPTRLVAQGCAPGSGQLASRFVVTGRGGVPLGPNDPLQQPTAIAHWIALDTPISQTEQKPIEKTTLSPATPAADPAPIIEAQGWVTDKNGLVTLVADIPEQNVPENTGAHSIWMPVVCKQ